MTLKANSTSYLVYESMMNNYNSLLDYDSYLETTNPVVDRVTQHIIKHAVAYISEGALAGLIVVSGIDLFGLKDYSVEYLDGYMTASNIASTYIFNVLSGEMAEAFMNPKEYLNKAKSCFKALKTIMSKIIDRAYKRCKNINTTIPIIYEKYYEKLDKVAIKLEKLYNRYFGKK